MSETKNILSPPMDDAEIASLSHVEVEDTIQLPKTHEGWLKRFLAYLNIFGFLRVFFGQTRDSTNRPNNILMLFYAACLIHASVLVGSVYFKGARYHLVLDCPPGTKQNYIGKKILKKSLESKEKSSKKGLRGKIKRGAKSLAKRIKNRLSRKRVRRTFNNPSPTAVSKKEKIICGGLKITIHLTLQPSPSLPGAVYWTCFWALVFIGMLYMGRHQQTRDWSVDLMYAWKGGSRRDGLDSRTASISVSGEGVSFDTGDAGGTVTAPPSVDPRGTMGDKKGHSH